MGNRMIKESTFTSDKIASLSDFEFRLWVGLITSVDDAGRGDARPAIIKGRVFPLRERVTVRDIADGLHGLAAKGCISLYTVGGKSYFWFPTWGDHQRIRDCKPKYPGPDEADPIPADSDNPPQSAASCGELRLELETKPTRTINQSEQEAEQEATRAGARESGSLAGESNNPFGWDDTKMRRMILSYKQHDWERPDWMQKYEAEHGPVEGEEET